MLPKLLLKHLAYSESIQLSQIVFRRNIFWVFWGVGFFFNLKSKAIFLYFLLKMKTQVQQEVPNTKGASVVQTSAVSKTNKTRCFLKYKLIFFLWSICSSFEHFMHHLLPILEPENSQISMLCSHEPPYSSAKRQHCPFFTVKGQGRIAIQTHCLPSR